MDHLVSFYRVNFSRLNLVYDNLFQTIFQLCVALVVNNA